MNKILEKIEKSIRQLAYMKRKFVTLLWENSTQGAYGVWPGTEVAEMRCYLPQRVASGAAQMLSPNGKVSSPS